MANELQAHGITGQTVYCVLRRMSSSGKIWNGAAFVTISTGDWTGYALTMTEVGSTGTYRATMPAVSAGLYHFTAYIRAGAAPASTDVQFDADEYAWAGTSTIALTSLTRYATTTELKNRIGIRDMVDDAIMGQVLDAVSRGIDNYCGRSFYASTAGVLRYYTPLSAEMVLIDDCIALSAVATDDNADRTYATTWATTDYDLLPENAAANGAPYDTIATTPVGSYCFPSWRRSLKLTGAWGWPAVPDPVHEACLIQGSRVFKRKDAPFGISGTPEMGQMRLGRLDPDVLWMLETYRKLVVA